MKEAWLIDDDEEMSTAVGLMLKMLDYSIRSFLTAPEAARALLKGEMPALVLLDINMPQVSGEDFLEFVRLRNAFDELPIVMISSEFTDVNVDKYLTMGADAYVFKPVSVDELEKAIHQAVAKRAPKANH